MVSLYDRGVLCPLRRGLVSYGKDSPYFAELLCHATDTQVRAQKILCGEKDLCVAEFDIPAEIFIPKAL